MQFQAFSSVGLSESKIIPLCSTVGRGVPYLPNNEKGWEVPRHHITFSWENPIVSAVLERNIMKPQLLFKFVSSRRNVVTSNLLAQDDEI